MNKPTAIEAAIVARAKALLLEKAQSVTESAERDERDAEKQRAEAAKLRDLVDALDTPEDFTPEGWLSPEQVAALEAEHSRKTVNLQATMRIEAEKHEKVLADIVHTKNEQIASYEKSTAILRDAAHALQADIVALTHDLQVAEQAVKDEKAKTRSTLDNMEKTYKQATEMLRAGCDADLARIKAEADDAENECAGYRENNAAYEAHFRNIQKALNDNGFACGTDFAEVISLVDSVVRIAASARDISNERRSSRDDQPRFRLRRAIAAALGEILGG